MLHNHQNCTGKFIYGKSATNLAKAHIKKECPVCGARYLWSGRVKCWVTVSSRPKDDVKNWVDSKTDI